MKIPKELAKFILPDIKVDVFALKKEIDGGMTPQDFVYRWFSKGGIIQGQTRAIMVSNNSFFRFLASEKGKKWIGDNLDGLLDYLYELAKKDI